MFGHLKETVVHKRGFQRNTMPIDESASENHTQPQAIACALIGSE